jgi:hypothetical protein
MCKTRIGACAFSRHHLWSHCPLEIAGFIDCLPDIKELFFVKRLGQASENARVRQWCSSREYMTHPPNYSRSRYTNCLARLE